MASAPGGGYNERREGSQVPGHHNLEAYLEEWIEAVGIVGDKKVRSARAANETRIQWQRQIVLAMIKWRTEAAALPYSTCCHTFRATGITTYLQNGGTLEHAQTLANHKSPRTSKLYYRTREELSFDEVERIKI